MKRFGKFFPFPTLPLLFGLLGLGLRFWQLNTGLDSKALLLPGHPANYGIPILLLLGCLTSLLISKSSVLPFSHRLLFPRSVPAAAGSWIAAAVFLYAAVTQFFQSRDSSTVWILLIGLLAAAGLLFAGIRRLRREHCSTLCHLAPMLLSGISLLIRYSDWSGDSQIFRYGYEAVTGICFVPTFFYRAALDKDIKNYRPCLFFCQLSGIFCCLCLVEEHWPLYLALLFWCLTTLYPLPSGDFSAIARPMELPKPILYCIKLLQTKGYQAYAVGGCVRDTALGLTPHDYDLCTNALPAEICKVFENKKLIRSGEKHGTIGVVLQDTVCEITTFRTEGSYSDSRHPDSVHFVPSLEEDLKRRDFTVNAMAYAPGTGYIDLYGGLQDLNDHRLQTVGDPQTRFREDALRILRGVRFSTRYGLIPDAATEQAMTDLAPLMDNLARERVFDELCKLLPHISAEDLLRFAPILAQVIPELKPCIGFQQNNPHHRYDVYTHTAHAVAAVSEDLPLRLAALLHDIGKPATYAEDAMGIGRFRNHAAVSAEMAEAVLRRLKASNALREQVVFLVAHHMTPLEPDRKLLLRRLTACGKEDLLRLLALQKADLAATGTADADAAFAETEQLLDQLLQEASCFHLKDLAINGHDILDLGVPAGPLVGRLLQKLLQQVQEDALPNTKEDLLDAAQKHLQAQQSQ